MDAMEGAIYQIMRDIWTAVLGLDVRWGEVPVPESGGWTASVRLSGAWNGIVVFRCSDALAHRVAAKMFAVNPDAAREDMIRDALGELTNMAAGNIKALLPEPCRLSLPGAEPVGKVPPGKPAARVGLECEGEPLVVTLVEEAPAVK